MQNKYIFSLILISGLMFLANACKDDDETAPVITENPFVDLNLPSTPFDYEGTQLPAHFLNNDYPNNFQFQFAAIESDNTPSANPITNEGVTLGRVLFYEKKLSINGTIACASCHKQEKGFSDDEILSLGFEGGTTRRHSMGLTNARFYQTGKFFWDERAESLEEQVFMPFQDEVEMGMTLEQIVQTVKDQTYAAPLFKDAFGDDTINSHRIAKALAQFVRSLVSVNAKYDKGRAQVNSPIIDFPNFTDEENLGKKIFNAQNLVAPSCNSCHLSEAFVGPLLAANGTTIGTNNGLDAISTDDLGIFEATNNNGHRGKFKAPSLRNVALRAPYMHDGRFNDLEEVINHYSTGIQAHPTLQPFLKDTNGDPIKYNFTDAEKAALLAFLNTLTDEEFSSAEKFSDPFK
ncbi:MAG: cytochrome c peroxidase [Bacteroidia bacterium]